ncbi:hypothetical protein L6259_00150 [Candidatus Parcubacteria bacterium]|nr:hypothetical protein [Candidatus Parcubacteria bacterium]
MKKKIKEIIRPAMFAAVLPLESVTVKPMAEIIAGLIGWLLAIVAGLAILFLIIGGIRYTRSWGDSDEMEKAKKMVIYVVLGLVMILVSYSIVITLDDVINNGGGGGGAVSITNTSVTPISGPIGTSFTIKATITAAAGVDNATVIAHIQSPDETDIITITLSPIGGGIYSGNWIATANGPYFVDITACDLSSNCKEADNI